MKTTLLAFCSLLLVPSVLLAAPAKGGGEMVAEGYPAWTGITPKNYIAGRVLGSAADLRQRVATIVVEFDASKTAEHLEKTGAISDFNGIKAAIGHGSTGWEALQLPRDVMVIYTCHSQKDYEPVKEGMKYKDTTKNPGLSSFSSSKAPVYASVTFEGAPATGALPFVYVLGYEGKTPLLKETYSAKTVASIKKIINEQKKKMAESSLEWKPFYGFVAEPKHFGKGIATALAKGKPLDAVAASILKNVTSSDAEKAKEAQMLYDGLEQTRSDMMFVAQCSLRDSPHVAAYNVSQVLKYWPKSKKAMSTVSDAIKANKDAQPLVKMYGKIREWSNPEFMCKNAGEAKKIVAELQKMKKQILPLTNDKNVTVQNGALMLDGILDELIAIVPTKVPTK